MKRNVYTILLGLFLYACRCTCTTDISGGGGSETTNSITVCIRGNQISGKAATGGCVELYYNSFNPIFEVLPDSLKAVADSSGRFSFINITGGSYNVYSYYDSADTFYRSLFISSLKVPSDTIVTKTYVQPSSVKIILQGDTQIAHPVTLSSAQLYFKGSPFYILQDLRSDDEFTLNQVPAGIYNCKVVNVSESSGLDVKFELPDSVIIKGYSIPDDSLFIQVKKITN
jgi:hypothetical protein